MNYLLKKHVEDFYKAGIRYDGRSMLEYRELTVELGVSLTAEGSAKVKLGNTEVIAGVKLSVDKPFSDTPNEGVLAVNAELLPLSNPEFESGPPNIESIELARVVDRGIRESKAIDTKALCITPAEKVWNVSLDILTINDDGNLIDCAAIAAIAALNNTRMPSYDGSKVDYKKSTDKKLPIRRYPIAITVFKLGSHFIVDPTREEREVMEARLTITVKEDNEICSLQKGLDYPLTLEDINTMLDIAIEKSNELRKRMM